MRPSRSARTWASVNDMIRAQHERRWDRKAEGFHTDHEPELGRLLDWQIGWLRSPEDFVDEVWGSSVHIVQAGTVGHDEASVHPFRRRAHRGQATLHREFYDLGPVRIEHRATIDEDSAHAFSGHCREDAADLAAATQPKRVQPQPQPGRRK